MTFEEFKINIMHYIQDNEPEVDNITSVTTLKNNGIFLDGVTIKAGTSNVAPTIYLNGYFKQLENTGDFNSIANIILMEYRKSKKNIMLDVSFFLDFERIKDRVVYKLINRKRNETLLKDIPYVEYMDLAIVFYYLMPNKGDEDIDGSILIKNEHMQRWNITTKDLMEKASFNTTRLLGLKVKGIMSTLAEYSNDDDFQSIAKETEGYVPLYVASNRKGYLGASVILYEDMLKSLAEVMNSDFFVIPCSIHEVIIMKIKKGCQTDIDSLKEMISYVNNTELSEGDILSDSLYYYSLKENVLSIV